MKIKIMMQCVTNSPVTQTKRQIGAGESMAVAVCKKGLLWILTVALAAVVPSCVHTGHAATLGAKSCSRQDVETAIGKAFSGDDVIVPAGTCTWSSTISIPSTKKINLLGAGIDSTIITMIPYGTAINATTSGSRVSGFTFKDGYVIVDGDSWRIDHCKFYRASDRGEGVQVVGSRSMYHPTGLVDHCYFQNTRVLVYGYNGLLAHELWAQPLALGSDKNVVYVEDSTFVATVFGNAIDADYGGRYVFRYNDITDTYAEAHSVQGNDRAARKWEIYKNIFRQANQVLNAGSYVTMWVPIMLRGGTGVVFDNTLYGNWELSRISLDNVRDCISAPVSGRCDGSSSWDGNTKESGYPCRDQIGRSTDTSLWTPLTPYPQQEHDPAYAWNNKHGAIDVLFYQHNPCGAGVLHIQPGRDYFDNTPRPGYLPFTYPHPLNQGGDVAVAPPQNLHVVEMIP